MSWMRLMTLYDSFVSPYDRTCKLGISNIVQRTELGAAGPVLLQQQSYLRIVNGRPLFQPQFKCFVFPDSKTFCVYNCGLHNLTLREDAPGHGINSILVLQKPTKYSQATDAKVNGNIAAAYVMIVVLVAASVDGVVRKRRELWKCLVSTATLLGIQRNQEGIGAEPCKRDAETRTFNNF